MTEGYCVMIEKLADRSCQIELLSQMERPLTFVKLRGQLRIHDCIEMSRPEIIEKLPLLLKLITGGFETNLLQQTIPVHLMALHNLKFRISFGPIMTQRLYAHIARSALLFYFDMCIKMTCCRPFGSCLTIAQAWSFTSRDLVLNLAYRACWNCNACHHDSPAIWQNTRLRTLAKVQSLTLSERVQPLSLTK